MLELEEEEELVEEGKEMRYVFTKCLSFSSLNRTATCRGDDGFDDVDVVVVVVVVEVEEGSESERHTRSSRLVGSARRTLKDACHLTEPEGVRGMTWSMP